MGLSIIIPASDVCAFIFGLLLKKIFGGSKLSRVLKKESILVVGILGCKNYV